MSPVRLPALLACVALTLAGCGGEKRAYRGAPGEPAFDVVRTNLNPTLAYAPWVIARDEGFFADERIRIELLAIDQSSALTGAVTGKLDAFSGAVRSGLFNAILRGAPIRIVADRGHAAPGGCATGAFAAPPQIADAIAAAGGNLRGRTFVLYRGGITEYMVDRLLEKRGVRRDQVTFTQLPQGEYASTASRRFDAIRYVQEPTLSSAVAAGEMKVIAVDQEFAPGLQHGVVLFGRRLTEDADLGRRVMRAYVRGVRRYNEGKTDRNVEIVSKYTKLPPDVVRRACWVPLHDDGRPNLESIDDQLAWARGHGYLDAGIAREQWWDPRFVEAVRREPAAAR